MTKPEIIGSIASTYTRVVSMVCEEKGIEYVLTERAPVWLQAAMVSRFFCLHEAGRPVSAGGRPRPRRLASEVMTAARIIAASRS